ncbi:MAG TPA: TetR/AcrR family transcriptional regulator [Pseudonocardiaceae bacterium]
MVDDKSSRTYRLGRRVDAMTETRQRITEATVQLHGTVGPARTTISSIAELAGVQRQTVYRHFPAEEELFAACSAHYWERHPWPDPASWRSGDSVRARITEALARFYAFYADVEPMLTNVLRDAPVVPYIEKVGLASYAEFLDGIARDLVATCAPPRDNRKAVAAAVRHALAFSTWQSLVRENRLSRRAAVELMSAMIEAARVR